MSSRESPDVGALKASKDYRGLGRALCFRDDLVVRGAAARALGELGTGQAVEVLVEALKEIGRSGGVLDSVVDALGMIEGGVDAAVDSFLVLISWEAPSVRGYPYGEEDPEFSGEEERRWAVEVFKSFGSPAVRATLRAVMEGTRVAFVVDILSAARGDDVDLLLEAFKNTESRVLKTVLIEVMGLIGDKRAVELIRPSLQSRDEGTRLKAATALHRLGWKPKGDAERALWYVAAHKWEEASLLGEAAIDALARAVDTPLVVSHRRFEPQDARLGRQTRDEAVRALVSIGVPAIDTLIEVLDRVYEAVEYSSQMAENIIIDGLVSIGEPAAEALLDVAEGSSLTWESPSRRSAIINILSLIVKKREIKDKNLEKRLIGFLVKITLSEEKPLDEYFPVDIGFERLLPHLIRCLAGSNLRIRELVAFELGMRERDTPASFEIIEYVGKTFTISVELVEALFDLVREDEEFGSFVEAALCRTRDEQVIARIVIASKDENESVRRAATRALERIREDTESEHS